MDYSSHIFLFFFASSPYPYRVTGSLHMQLALLQNRGPRDDHNMWGRLYQKKTTSHFCALRWHKLGNDQFKLLVETAALCCLLFSFQADTSGCQGQQQIRSEQEGSFGCRMFCRCGENPMPVASNFPIIFPTLDSAMNRSGKPGFLREYLLL